jgi:hypothetical protein
LFGGRGLKRELVGIGADSVIVEGEDLPERVRFELRGAIFLWQLLQSLGKSL